LCREISLIGVIAMNPLGTSLVTPETQSAKTAHLRALSVELEATFLTEMLKHSGLGEAQKAFGGGIGEEQFTSMRLQQTAQQITKAGGIGLAESIFQSLLERAQ
jgi:Rod binding domain-containing protein